MHPFGNRESYGDSSTDLSKFTLPGIKDYFCRKEGRTRCPTFFFFLEKLPKPSLRIPLVFFASLPPLPPPSLLPLLQRGQEPSPPRALQGAFHRLFFCVNLLTALEPLPTSPETPRHPGRELSGAEVAFLAFIFARGLQQGGQPIRGTETNEK